MKLFYSPGACSLSPHIVATEAGVPVELVKVDLQSHRTAADDDFHAINPKGYVPALQLDDGSLLTEGTAIVQYLADQRPASGLAPPAGSTARYRLQEWLAFIGSELHKSYSPLFSKTTPAETRAERVAYLQKRYATVEARLQDSPWLVGGEFTAADAYLFTVTNWARLVKVDLSAFPQLLAFQARVAARPQVQAAMRAEGVPVGA
jgi:glutathione S-transferase